MDNVTHSLVGWALADAVILGLRRRQLAITTTTTAQVFRVVSIAAANGPDVDLLYGLVDRSRLAYLVHHRGHTHTIAALALFWILGALLFAWAKRRGRVPLLSWQWAVLGALAALSLVSHLLLDYGNNYGIHPFWPLDNHWYYGDSVFIIEPWLWILLGLGLYRADTSRRTKVFFALLALATILLPWLSAMATLPTALSLNLAVLLCIILCWRYPQAPRLSASLVAIGLFLGLMYGLCRGIKQSIQQSLQDSLPSWDIQDIVLTPRPANPLCWSVMAIAADQQDRYHILGGSFAVLNTEGQRQSCRALADRPQNIPPSAASLPLTLSHLDWLWAYQGDQNLLRQWRDRSCAVRAFGQFARAPFWFAQGQALFLGDARYDRSPQQDFAEIIVDETTADDCPGLGAPWIPPRSSLFDMTKEPLQVFGRGL